MKKNILIRKKYSRILSLTLGMTLATSLSFAAQGAATFFGTASNNNLPIPLPNTLPTGFNMIPWVSR